MTSNATASSLSIIGGPEKINLLNALFFEPEKPLYFTTGDNKFFVFNLRGMILSEISPQFVTLIITHRGQQGGKQETVSVAYDLHNKTGRFMDPDVATTDPVSTMGTYVARSRTMRTSEIHF